MYFSEKMSLDLLKLSIPVKILFMLVSKYLHVSYV